MIKTAVLVLLFLITLISVFTFIIQPKRIPQITDSATTSASVRVLPSGSLEQTVSGEEVIRSFFDLLNRGDTDEAISLMDETAVADAGTKEQWKQFFGSFTSLTLLSLEAHKTDQWSETSQVYRTVISAVHREGTQTLWEEGQNTFWIPLVKRDTQWKITAFASGP